MSRCDGKCIHSLGCIMVVLGFSSLMFCTAIQLSVPTWSGLAVVATGILAVLSGKRPVNLLLLIPLLVFSVTLFCCLFTILEAHLKTLFIPCHTSTTYIISYGTDMGENITVFEEFSPDSSSAPSPVQVVCEALTFTEVLLTFVLSVAVGWQCRLYNSRLGTSESEG